MGLGRSDEKPRAAWSGGEPGGVVVFGSASVEFVSGSSEGPAPETGSSTDGVVAHWPVRLLYVDIVLICMSSLPN